MNNKHTHGQLWPMAKEALGRTPLSTSMSTGMAVLFVVPSMAVAGYINRRTGFDDDWAMLALPVGVVFGLILSIRYRTRKWQKIVGIVLFLLCTVLVAWLATPVQVPGSVPPGMNRLPYGIATLLKEAALAAVLITAILSAILSFIAHTVQLMWERRSERRRRTSAREAIRED